MSLWEKNSRKCSGVRIKFRALRICARQARSRFLARVTSYYGKLWIRCGNEKGGVPFRVDHANPGGSRVEGDATDVEGSGKDPAGEESGELLPLDEIARVGARRMLMAELATEAADYVERHRDERDDEGRALVVHNGRSQGRKLTLGTGTVELKAPRVNDRRRDEQGQRQRFTSRILPPYMRRSPKVAEVLPILYLRGLSTGDFRPALEGLLGEDAAGLSPTNIARLTACWEKEYTAFRQRDLAGRKYV